MGYVGPTPVVCGSKNSPGASAPWWNKLERPSYDPPWRLRGRHFGNLGGYAIALLEPVRDGP